MVTIKKVWLTTLNRDEKDAGISEASFVNLTVNIDGEDRFENDYAVSDKAGCGAFFEGFIPIIDKLFDSDSLTNSSIRLGMRGEDAWAPDHILVLGETDPPEGQSRVLPLAVEVDQKITLSTDSRDAHFAHVSMPVRIAGSGSLSTVIRRVLLLLQTDTTADAGTDDPIEIEITAGGTRVAKQEFRRTAQDDLERGATNRYFVDVLTPFTKADVQSNGKIKMSILEEGVDAWNPSRVFVYGFDTAEGRPTQIVDLVSIPIWSGGWFSKDTTEGQESRDLPLS
jgi:hypothetical protein